MIARPETSQIMKEGLTEANLALLLHLPLIGDEAVEKDGFSDVVRQALAIKIRCMALLDAFREREGTGDAIWRLIASAGKNISDRNYVLSVAEHVYRSIGIEDEENFHPDIEDVIADVTQRYKRIADLLIRQNSQETQDDDWGEPPQSAKIARKKRSPKDATLTQFNEIRPDNTGLRRPFSGDDPYPPSRF